LTLRRHFTFHQQRFNSSYPSRQFPIPLKVTIALEIFTHNISYFINCRKKKLLAFPDLDSIHLFTCLWRNFPFLVISKVAVTFDVCFDKLTRQILKLILLFIELYVAWQLREGTQFSIVIQRVGTKLPEIFDLRYEYLFLKTIFTSERSERVKIVLRNKYEWSEEKISDNFVPTSLYSA
jgi:hypothetical protein